MSGGRQWLVITEEDTMKAEEDGGLFIWLVDESRSGTDVNVRFEELVPHINAITRLESNSTERSCKMQSMRGDAGMC